VHVTRIAQLRILNACIYALFRHGTTVFLSSVQCKCKEQYTRSKISITSH